MINFGMTSAGRSTAATPPRAGVQPLASPKENVSLVINSSTGICIANIPYGTPKAGSIRAYLAARMVNDANQRLFLWRRETDSKVRIASMPGRMGSIVGLAFLICLPYLVRSC